MSLIAHYRLDTDILDSSGKGNHPTLVGGLTQVSGKVNGAYSFTNGSMNIDITNENLMYDFSAAFWVKMDSFPASRCGIMETYYGAEIALNVDVSGSLQWYYGTSGTQAAPYTTHVTASNTVEVGNWVHIVLVRDIKQNITRFYKNGVNVNNNTLLYVPVRTIHNTLRIGYSYTGNLLGSLDDVRIYDHALSDKEIKELAKGEVVHYTFDDFQEPTTNLLYDNGNINWSIGNLVGSFTRTTIIENLKYRITSSASSTSFRFYIPLSKLTNGETYTLSYRYSIIQGSIFYMLDWCDTTLFNKVDLVGFSSASGTKLTYDSTYRFMDFQMSADSIVDIWDIQLEQKTYYTPFVVGSRTGKIMDNTGNGNDAILIEATTPRWVNTSKIGTGCYYFKGINEYITTGLSTFSSLTTCTITFWRKNDTIVQYWLPFVGQTGSYYIMATTSGTGNFYHSNAGTSLEIYKDGVNYGTAVAPFTDQEWHHYAIKNVNLSTWTVFRLSGYGGDWNCEGYFDDLRIYNTNLSDSDILQLYQNRHTLDYNGNFFTPRLNETGHKSMYMDYTLWQDGQTGSVGMFSQNGSTTENYRVISDDPWGKQTVVWEARPDATSGADGGWGRSSYIPIDNTKTHRISTWIRRTVIGNGNYYLGTNGGGAYVLDLAGSANNNPYFMASTLSTTEWRLYVGHVHPYGYSGSTHPDSGVYNVNGEKLGSAADYKCDAGTVSLNHRSYLYYSTDTSTRQQWVYPRFDVCDGTEPSITELLAGYDSNNIDYIRTIGGTRNLSLDAGVSVANIGKISEVGITNGLVAYYPLDGNANDYSGNDYSGTVISATLASGIKDECYQFSNGGTYINLPNYIGYTTSVSAFAWFKSLGTPGTAHHIIFGGQELEISINTSDYLRTGVYTSARYVYNSSSGVGLLNGQWHHVGLTFSNGRLCSYIDGVKYVDQSGISGALTNTFSNRRIGVYGGDTIYYTNGLIDDVRIYNRELSSEEVIILYEMGLTDKKMKLTKDTIYIKGEIKEGY